MYEPITIERLSAYVDGVKELDRLLYYKKGIEEKIGSLNGVDYSQTKVNTGKNQKISEQERFTIALEKVNKRIDEWKIWLNAEHEIIITQIARVKKWEYRKILVLRYVEGWKWAEVVQEFFEFEKDYEEEKHTKYRETIMRWNRNAIKELEEVSSKPYIPATKQLGLPEIEENEEKNLLEINY